MPGSKKENVSFERLAIALGVDLPKLFEMLPMPDTWQAVAQRRRKKLQLDLDVSAEDQAIKMFKLERELKKMREEIAAEPPLSTEQIHKLGSLAREVFRQ